MSRFTSSIGAIYCRSPSPLASLPHSCLSDRNSRDKAILDDGWYLPGQTIHLDASIANRSNSTISSMEVRLVEATTYLGFHGYKRHQRVIKNEMVKSCQEIYVASGDDYDCSLSLSIHSYNRHLPVYHRGVLRQAGLYVVIRNCIIAKDSDRHRHYSLS
ncbi:hypothetical protein PENTCL1PPCAC_9718, partial [Pristionchus entomophagus]